MRLQVLEGNLGFRILADSGFKGHRKLLYRGFLSFGVLGLVRAVRLRPKN